MRIPRRYPFLQGILSAEGLADSQCSVFEHPVCDSVFRQGKAYVQQYITDEQLLNI